MVVTNGSLSMLSCIHDGSRHMVEVIYVMYVMFAIYVMYLILVLFVTSVMPLVVL